MITAASGSWGGVLFMTSVRAGWSGGVLYFFFLLAPRSTFLVLIPSRTQGKFGQGFSSIVGRDALVPIYRIF